MDGAFRSDKIGVEEIPFFEILTRSGSIFDHGFFVSCAMPKLLDRP